jgi:hypothetical protein
LLEGGGGDARLGRAGDSGSVQGDTRERACERSVATRQGRGGGSPIVGELAAKLAARTDR